MKQLMANLLKLQTLEMSKDSGTTDGKKTIESLRTTVPPQILGHYDRMLARGKKGVAVVRNGVCRACHVRLAIGVLQVLRHGSDIQLCGNCGRYLLLEEEVAAVVAPVAVVVAAAAPKKRGRKPKKALTVQHAA